MLRAFLSSRGGVARDRLGLLPQVPPCVWRSLPYRALGATAPDLRPPGRRSPPQKRNTAFLSSNQRSWLERTRIQLYPAVFRCIHCIRVPSIHAVLRTVFLPCEVGVIHPTRRLARLRLRHQRADPSHRSLSRRRGRDAAEMRPRCGRDAAEMQPRCSRDAACMRRDTVGESLSPHLRLGRAVICR